MHENNDPFHANPAPQLYCPKHAPEKGNRTRLYPIVSSLLLVPGLQGNQHIHYL